MLITPMNPEMKGFKGSAPVCCTHTHHKCAHAKSRHIQAHTAAGDDEDEKERQSEGGREGGMLHPPDLYKCECLFYQVFGGDLRGEKQ